VTAATGTGQVLRLSADGYIRLAPAMFRQIALQHLISGIDEEGDVDGAARSAPIVGYTEWISMGNRPSITIGWDWQLGIAGEGRNCRRLGEPRSNVMLLDEDNEDLGLVWTGRYLATAIDAMEWSSQVLNAVALRYS
jgi:hypothetical protein